MARTLRYLSLFLLAIFSLSAQAQTPSGLIAHWMLGGNGADSSGNGLHGTVVGATPDTGRNQKPNTAMRFNGESFISIPYNALLNTTNFSIASIVKLEVFNPDACNLNTIFWRGNEFMNGCYSMIVFDNAFDSSCSIVDTGANVFAGSIGAVTHPRVHSFWQYKPTVKSQQWYSAVLTFDGTTARVYVNGVQMSANYLGDPVGSSTEGAVIGMRYFNNGAYPYPWRGLIDDVQLYNRVLADSEILQYHYYDTARPVTVPVDTTTTPDTTTNLSLPEHKASSFKVFPSPATNMLNIALPGVDGAEIVVINAVGQVMHRERAANGLLQIPTGSWARGHYVVRAVGGGVTAHRKILLQ